MLENLSRFAVFILEHLARLAEFAGRLSLSQGLRGRAVKVSTRARLRKVLESLRIAHTSGVLSAAQLRHFLPILAEIDAGIDCLA